MRRCPRWFQDALTKLGGLNPFGEPLYKLVWSTEPKMVIGGKWADGFVGYREVNAVHGEEAWALMVWEPAEFFGSPSRWEYDYRDEETGLLQCGAYPSRGRYRLLQKFLHIEIVQQAYERHWMDRNGEPRIEVLAELKTESYRLEPCGVLLDMLIPMLISWRKLSDHQKREALKQQEQLRKDEFSRRAKDARDGTRLSRIMRGSQLVQKRAELIERGMREAMKVATQYGLGMRVA